ncbi:hypothetical protein JTB14_035991 [Gonioctena quinquepunctata]|nr:hypothetical protein JTB14_035991 [Gonioctena quinquepunctata]
MDYKEWTEKLTNAANIAIPKTSITLGKKKFVEKPCWWDEECNEQYRLRGTALREYRNQATDENFYNYKKTAAKMRKITRRKRNQFTETLNRDTPIGHIWNVVRKFARSAAGENRHATENENWIADLLNSLTPPYIPENNNRIVDTNQEQSPLFTVEELMVELGKKKETAPGTDQISYSMIRKLPENMIIKLVHFYNSILRGTMNVPEERKTQTVIPTLKRDKDPNKYDSYRPLVLAPYICKLFESMLKNRIEHKLENEKFFGDMQTGFRKAYDNVNLSKLRESLNQANVNEDIIKIIMQLLEIRRISIRSPNTGELSGPQEAHKGLSQGDFIREKGLVSENMCNLGLTAVNSADILDLMYSDFQEKYEEYCKHQRDRQAKEMIDKQRAMNLAASQEKSKADITEQAIQSAAQWNARFNKTRKDQRRSCMDLQTLTVHYPKGRMKQLNKASTGNYPVALVPGQFTDFYEEFTPTEINNLPLNTLGYGPVTFIPREVSEDSGSEGSDSDSDSSGSSSSGSNSDSSSDVEDCKMCKHSPKRALTPK